MNLSWNQPQQNMNMNNMQENQNLPDLGQAAKTIGGLGEAIVDQSKKTLEDIVNNVPTQITTSDQVREYFVCLYLIWGNKNWIRSIQTPEQSD